MWLPCRIHWPPLSNFEHLLIGEVAYLNDLCPTPTSSVHPPTSAELTFEHQPKTSQPCGTALNLRPPSPPRSTGCSRRLNPPSADFNQPLLTDNTTHFIQLATPASFGACHFLTPQFNCPCELPSQLNRGTWQCPPRESGRNSPSTAPSLPCSVARERE